MSSLGEALPVRAAAVQWPAIIAGAIGAAGISFTLHAFATGIGLSVFSTSPSWRDASIGLVLLSGLYVLFVAMAAFGFGGYIAGRMRAPLNAGTIEVEFRDGIHGLITWALAIVLTALLALGATATASPAIAPGSSAAGLSQSVAGEALVVTQLDNLFRSDRDIPDISYRRSEAGRILLKASSHDGVPETDREYLTDVVSRETATPRDVARGRVDTEIDAAAKELRRARVIAVLQAFFIGAALFVGAAIAWFAACEGGREREAGAYPIWDWSWRPRTYTKLT